MIADMLNDKNLNKIVTKGFINLYHIFLVIHATVGSDNPSRFRKNLLETNHHNC